MNHESPHDIRDFHLIPHLGKFGKKKLAEKAEKAESDFKKQNLKILAEKAEN